MKVSELIRELECFQKLHGDLEVDLEYYGQVELVQLVEDGDDRWCMLLNQEYVKLEMEVTRETL